MNVDFLILAAGQGKRLKPLTDNIPKGLVKIHNIPIIKNHLIIANKLNIKNSYIVTGYKASKIKFPKVKKIYNKDYENTNMVHSLFIALQKVIKNRSDLIISYSDIIYNETVFKKLLNSKHKFSVICDDSWRKYWSKRFKNILEDAESCKIDEKNNIIDIGQKINDYSKIDSQYIGLMKFNYKAKKEIYAILKSEYINNSKISSICNKRYANLYLTDLLQYLILKRNKIKAIRIKGGWVEIDSIKDFNLSLKITKRENNLISVFR
tara:strand:- start:1896 stop:2690 length:795 start_codon:yes stop_codon:yes gene_type:complete